ncbi:MAG TPA: CHAT domain-containing protein [Stenomitos sp.]
MPKRISLLIVARKLEHYLSTRKFLLACLSTVGTLLIPSFGGQTSSWLASLTSVSAQSITSDNSTNTIVTPQSNPNASGNSAVYDITGGQLSQDGQNLFHSFSQFGLGAGETANFIANPSVLNILGRVTGGNPSIINGLIQVTSSGNPNLFLMNPAGIVFGDKAQLNVPGDFTATTATRIGFGNNNGFNAVGTNDYSALIGTPSTFAFGTSATPGAIANSGQLAVTDGKNLTLLGGTVVSTGELKAPGGNLTIAAVPGQNLVRISQSGHLLNLEIQPCGNSTNCTLPATSNSPLPTPLSLPQLLTGNANSPTTGLTVDNAGQVVLTNSGLLVPQSPGTLVLSGTADTSTTKPSEIGGSVQLRGNLVGLVEKAQVDASGTAGGGRVLIGGDVWGSGTDSQVLQTFVGPDVRINANAGATGNGGQVRVWAGDTTRFLGEVNARGGASSGNGGFVEVSGTKNLSVTGTVDTLAANRERGTLFLNSSNLTLTDAEAVTKAQNRILANNPQILLSDNKTGLNTISWGQIADLAPNNNIVLQASGSIAIADIFGNTPGVTQNNGVNLGAKAGSLTFRSTGRSITFQDFNDTIQTSGSSLTLEAATKLIGGNFLTNGGAVTLKSQNELIGGNFLTNGGAVTLKSQNDSITTGQINTSSASGNGGRVTLNAQKDITVNSIDTRSLSNGTGGNVEITTSSLFRAWGTNSSNASISTAGGTQGGSISIRHGGGSSGIPFIVGSNYNGLNGTAGTISTGTNNQISSGIFLGSYSQGNSPSGIQVITSGNNTNTPQPQVITPPQQNHFTQVPLSGSSSLPPVAIDTGVAEVDKSLTQRVERYFDRSFNPASLNLTQVRDTLDRIDQVTGKKPALIYTVFVPATLESPSSGESQTAQPTDQLELILVTAQGKTIRKRVEGATRDRVLNMAQEFRNHITNVKSDDYLSSSRQLYQWLVEPLEAELQTQKINNIVFLMDSGLRAVPIAALHDGRGFLVERYSVGLMPSFNLTDTRYQNLKNVQVLAMGAEKFPNQTPLPAVPLELSVITEKLWKGKAFLNNAFTLENLKAQRQQASFGIIHLATHADFQPGSPDNSYIQLANGKLLLNQIPRLNWSNPPVELLVLSACRTAVGNEQAELGFAGLAVQAGVKSAVASLWIVSDEATLGLMTEFYRQLGITPIKAEALRQAQLAMLKGEVRVESGQLVSPQGAVTLPPVLARLGDKKLTHPYYWAAFTMIGNPW